MLKDVKWSSSKVSFITVRL